jgi:putative ubiquitin-RnfH superfamily antitoxin RatB of RatAB toxin-antitoxin module
VEFALALPAYQWLFQLNLSAGSSAIDVASMGLARIASDAQSAAAFSNTKALVPDSPWQASSWRLGIFSKPCAYDYKLQSGDRVELYRPLQIDPMQSRRSRAKQAAKQQLNTANARRTG